MKVSRCVNTYSSIYMELPFSPIQLTEIQLDLCHFKVQRIFIHDGCGYSHYSTLYKGLKTNSKLLAAIDENIGKLVGRKFRVVLIAIYSNSMRFFLSIAKN